MLYEYRLETPKEGFIDITDEVRDACRQSGVFDGMMTVYCPHTTAGVTINENTDPDVEKDLLLVNGFPECLNFFGSLELVLDAAVACECSVNFINALHFCKRL